MFVENLQKDNNAKSELTVIVPVCNSKDTLKECLAALYRSAYRDFKAVVVDDYSIDCSVKIAQEFPCKVIELKERKGTAYARNRGAENTESEFLLFMDSDIVVKPDSITKIINAIKKNSTISGVSGTYSQNNKYKNFFSQYKHLIACFRDKKCEDANQDSFRGAFFVVRRGVFDAVHFNEESKKASIEDIEFGRESIGLGYKFILDNSIQVEHLRKFTLTGFIKNQFKRSQDILCSFLSKKSYKFYLNSNRKNKFSKLYFLRVPVSLLMFLFLFGFLFFGNPLLLLLFSSLFILLAVYLEHEFLCFCLGKKGFVFVTKCVLAYFLDGVICGLGILKGILSIFICKNK